MSLGERRVVSRILAVRYDDAVAPGLVSLMAVRTKKAFGGITGDFINMHW